MSKDAGVSLCVCMTYNLLPCQPDDFIAQCQCSHVPATPSSQRGRGELHSLFIF